MRRSFLMAIGPVVAAARPIMFGQDASLERGKYLLKAEDADVMAAF
jgi:hypothetical protein